MNKILNELEILHKQLSEDHKELSALQINSSNTAVISVKNQINNDEDFRNIKNKNNSDDLL